MAPAVAAPIPRLAPVTTATRPASQCTGSPPVIRTGQLPVEPFVRVQAQGQVQMLLGVVAAGRPRNPGRPRDGPDGGFDVIGRYQETGHAVRDHLAEAPAAAIPKASSHRTGYRTTAARAIAAHSDVRGTAP